MSTTETWVGKMILVKKQDQETLEDVCRRTYMALRAELGLPEKEFYFNDKYDNSLLEEHYKEFEVARDDLYDLRKCVNSKDDDIVQATKDDDGNLDVVLQFYNGGAGLGEVIEWALDQLDE